MKKKVLITCLLISLLSVMIVFTASLTVIYKKEEDKIKEQIIANTDVLAKIINKDNYESLALASGLDSERITIMDINGDVLFESDTGSQLNNHLDREEIALALKGTPRIIKRYSATFGCKMYYYALVSGEGENAIIIRLAVRTSEIWSYIGGIIPFIMIALIISLSISYLFVVSLSKEISGKFMSIQDNLKNLNNGKYVPINVSMADKEFYPLIREINDLSANLNNNISETTENKNRLNYVLDNISQSIIALDKKNNIELINRQALTMFSNTESVVKKKLYYLIDNQFLMEKVEKMLVSKENEHSEFNYKERDYTINIIKTKNDNFQDINNIIIITDISGEKELIKKKTEFFANASHELKTPLTTMQGMSELILTKGEIDEKSKGYVARINKECQRLNGLILDMLRISKLESVPELNNINLQVSKVVNEVVGKLGDIAKEKGINTVISGDAEMNIDYVKLYELIENLYSNAVNYNKPNGTIDIVIENKKKFIILSVADSGIGIEKEHIPRLCERFYRVDKSRSKSTGGTGLGLSIVKHICLIYNAELLIESEINRGTKISIIFKK